MKATEGGSCKCDRHRGHTRPLAEECLLLLLGQRLRLGAFDVIVDVSVEPLWIVKRALREDN